MSGLMFGFSGVKLSQGVLRDPLQHLFGEDPHELPSDVQSLEHTPVLVGAWVPKQTHNSSTTNLLHSLEKEDFADFWGYLKTFKFGSLN